MKNLFQRKMFGIFRRHFRGWQLVPTFFHNYCFIQTFKYCPYVLENIFGNETWRYVTFYWKKQNIFNPGLCWLFSEKRYICFLVNILAALLIIFVPNLVRKCQIMCSRIWVEEIVFLKFSGFVSKDNRFLLVAIATVVKENFPQFKITLFFILMLFLQTKTFSEVGTGDIFSRRFSVVCISMATEPKIWTYTNIFL